MLAITGLSTACIAIVLDTDFYKKGHVTWSTLLLHPVITPINNFMYNLSSDNLLVHGLHPWYQHILLNIPLLLGPAIILLFFKPQISLRFYSAISGTFVLSFFRHQEARFLLPSVPLLLSSVQLPRRKRGLYTWVGSWIVFNGFFGVLMGVYHQGGIVPMQTFLSQRDDVTQAIWWKTYSPPIWLLDGKNEFLDTYDVMGMKGGLMIKELQALVSCDNSLATRNGTYLVAPLSANFLDMFVSPGNSSNLNFEEIWRYQQHLNLDDLDFAEDGIWKTLQRVIGRRGLAAWKVTRSCI